MGRLFTEAKGQEVRAKGSGAKGSVLGFQSGAKKPLRLSCSGEWAHALPTHDSHLLMAGIVAWPVAEVKRAGKKCQGAKGSAKAKGQGQGVRAKGSVSPRISVSGLSMF